MRFGTHLKLLEAIEQERYEEFLSETSVKERMELIKAKNNIYPLPKTPDPERVREMSNRYNLYTNILHMKLGQFIMLESQIRSKNSRDEVIASLLIRPKDELAYDNEDIAREEQISKMLSSENILDVYSVIQSMMLNREFVLFTKFAGVIYSKVEPSDEEEEAEEDDKTGDDEFNSQWFWYRIVRELAQSDIRRFNDIYDLSMSVVMVELSFLAQKSILENARMRSEEARQRAAYRR